MTNPRFNWDGVFDGDDPVHKPEPDLPYIPDMEPNDVFLALTKIDNLKQLEIIRDYLDYRVGYNHLKDLGAFE